MTRENRFQLTFSAIDLTKYAMIDWKLDNVVILIYPTFLLAFQSLD